MIFRNSLFAILMVSFILNSYGQSPYQLNWEKELLAFGTGATTFGLGVYLRNQTPRYTPNQIESLNKNSINGFDRGAINHYSVAAHNASDVFFYGSYGLPLLFLAQKKTRKDMGTIALLWGETILLNSGLTILSKYSFRRTRPFVYNPDVPINDKLTWHAKSSFFSGHTSTAASNTFFIAKVFSDYYPDSKWKPVVWGAAVLIPATTGFLRVKAGKHFPTDVIAGFAIGAAVGYFVPHFHKKKKMDNRWSVYGGMSGVMLRYQF
jgi:membrane-associated phospholipid phosphatase